METLKKSIFVALFVIYEFLLIDYAANSFTLTKTWFFVSHSMPVFQTDIEFVILLGQVPVLVIYFISRQKMIKRVEDEILDKRRKKNNRTTS